MKKTAHQKKAAIECSHTISIYTEKNIIFELIYRLNGHEILIYSRGNKSFVWRAQRENVFRKTHKIVIIKVYETSVSLPERYRTSTLIKNL